MEILPEFALELAQEQRMLSSNITAGYQHFQLAPQMRDWFVFAYDGRFYRCIAIFHSDGDAARCGSLTLWCPWQPS
jgi:hypothetical protein